MRGQGEGESGEKSNWKVLHGKSKSRNLKLNEPLEFQTVQSEISTFGFSMQDFPILNFSLPLPGHACWCSSQWREDSTVTAKMP
jgi:hypothetical protein